MAKNKHVSQYKAYNPFLPMSSAKKPSCQKLLGVMRENISSNDFFENGKRGQLINAIILSVNIFPSAGRKNQSITMNASIENAINPFRR
ncbi:hypothetical protein [Pseudocitrobacter cyperus]|uniref:Uncharacterized protein n=1 Tax=Pseudocitrobacter cyperus TaxID=3112843 RepID=A0ABV0HNC5_9ENTR